MNPLNVLVKGRPATRWTRFAVAGLFAAVLAGCGGSDGAAGAPGAPGAPGADVDPTVVNNLTAQITALTQATNPETCVACHTGTSPLASGGAAHQAEYNKYKDASKFSLAVDGVTSVANGDGTYTATMTFTVSKSGVPLTATQVAALGQKTFYAVPYDSATGKYGASFSFSGGTTVSNYVATVNPGQFQVKQTKATFAPETVTCAAPLVCTGAEAYAYVADGLLNTEGSQKLYDDVANAAKAYGDAATYTSAANVAACESCHGTPYMKHGYRAAKVTNLADFGACKNCHYDSRDGHDLTWQIEKDDPARAAAIAGGSALTADENTKYAYKASLMNDVHMSHAMEFPYPQAMNSCVTCHAGKLDTIFADSKFKAETCISCHSVEGIKTKMKAAGFTHATQTASDAALRASTCSTCHNGADAPTSSTIHSGGYNPKIYATDGTRYSTAITAAIPAVTYDSTTKKLNIKVTAQGSVGTVVASNITPTVLVGLYGYDTKDFIVPAHGTNADKARNLEWVYGTTNARFAAIGKTTTAGVTTWELTADLSGWADLITSGAVKRVEVAAMPTLKHPTLVDPTSTTTPKANLILALNAPSKTFDLTTKAFGTTAAIIPADANTCNNCHDALATTFHSGDRGGNVVVCRICHEVTNPGAHLEMQSRSIDSYVHAIHSFQAFDIKNIDLTDPVAAMEYKYETNSGKGHYPNFTIKNCESCHAAGTYDVPNQAKSMPSVLSVSSAFKAGTRDITAVVPQSVVGPANRACGSCHRSQVINANNGLGDSTQLAILNSHMKQNGYMVDASAYSSSTTPTLYDLWKSLTTKLMNMF